MGKGFEGRENHKPNFSNKSLRGRRGNSDRRGGRGIGAKGEAKTIIEPNQKFPEIFISTTQKKSHKELCSRANNIQEKTYSSGKFYK